MPSVPCADMLLGLQAAAAAAAASGGSASAAAAASEFAVPVTCCVPKLAMPLMHLAA